MTYKSFETERLIIRPTTDTDAEFIFKIMNTPKWIKYIGDRDIKTIENAEHYIKEKITPELERLGFSNYTVISKEDNMKIGTCGLYDREGLKGIDIGFAFLPEYEGNGYAFEAANKLKEIAINNFKIKKLSAITTKDNISSQKLLNKLGLKAIGKTKFIDGEVELLVYQLQKYK
jgi:RimJ/RimL family protein N-acetyltransferase